jgi:adenine-specific DNA methylase
MQKLKEDNAELLARAKEEMEKAKEEENRVKSQLSQVSFLETSHKYDPAKEEAHIRDLERKWIKEAETIVTPSQVSQQDSELQALLEKQKVKEAESEAQLEQMKAKLNKDIEILNKDIAENSVQLTRSGASFLQVGSKGPAETALERAEADLQKLKQQLREETAKLNAMHFDAPTF